MLVDVATEKQTVLLSPQAGVFEAKLALGKKVKPGDLVAVVHPPPG